MNFRNILVVDSNSDAAAHLSRTLAALGYHVEVAPTSAMALALARSLHFDVGIFSELLTDGEGTSLFRRISSIQQGIRGVLLTATGNLFTVWKAISAGMQRVIVRPIDFTQLLPIVESAGSPEGASGRPAAPRTFEEVDIAALTSEEIRYRLSRDELIQIIQRVDYPFAGKGRLMHFDRDTLERVVHLVRRWCQVRCGPHPH